MSKFYGSITGSAKHAATRCGTKNSGIESHTRGWDQGVRVSGWTAGTMGPMPGCALKRSDGRTASITTGSHRFCYSPQRLILMLRNSVFPEMGYISAAV